MKTPKPPDPMVTAQAQSGMNRDTAITQQILNSGTQVNPWGTTSTEQTGTSGFTDSQGNWVETPTFTTTQTLTPEQQAIFDRTQQAETNLAGIASEQSARIGDLLNDPFSYDVGQHEAWSTGIYDKLNADAISRDREGLHSTLVNRGIQPGTRAYDDAMANMLSGQQTSRDRFALDSYQTGLSSALTQRNQPLNEIIGLMSGSQIQNPAAMNAQTPQTGVGGVDYTGLVNQQYQAELQNSQAKMGGLFGLLSAPFQMFRFSDARLKENIRPIGETSAGLPIYIYNYKGDPTPMMGVMAHEALMDQPEAVSIHPSGFLMVNYGKVH